MQPTHAVDVRKLYDAWTRFVSIGHLEADLDPLVAVSWQRCAPRLNPRSTPQWAYVSTEVLPVTLSQHAVLTRIACPIMEDLHQAVEGASALFALTDSTGCVLELIGEAARSEETVRLGLRRGAFLDEGRIGTNAFSIALIESSPARVVGAEHFLSRFHELATVAAPIHNLDGRPMGAIGMVESVEKHTFQSLGIVVAAARAVENQFQADLFVREANARATELNATLDAVSEGVLAWTAQGVITHLNDSGGRLLDLAPTMVVGRPLAEHITLPESLARAAARGEELVDAELGIGVNGAVREFLVTLRIVRQPEAEPRAYILTLRRLDQVRQLVTRLVGAQARLTLEDIVGHGPATRRVRRQALSAAKAKGCVLLSGEPGTSKNPLARAIHNSGQRAGGPFLAMNCRAIPRELVLGEFLGFEAGAFNSVPSSGQPSKFELADRGTLYLEEVEALPLEMQAALVRFIESGEVIRLGGRRVIPVDVRLIASTEVDLESRLADGAFRADLFFRLRSFVIQVPPLRERLEDLPLLVRRLLERLSLQFGRTIEISDQALSVLAQYPWPGNITELETVVERATLHSEGQTIQVEHLPDSIRQRRAKLPSQVLTEPVYSLAESERHAILCAGRAAKGNISQTAQLLGIGRTTLWRKLKEFGLTSQDLARLLS